MNRTRAVPCPERGVLGAVRSGTPTFRSLGSSATREHPGARVPVAYDLLHGGPSSTLDAGTSAARDIADLGAQQNAAEGAPETFASDAGAPCARELARRAAGAPFVVVPSSRSTSNAFSRPPSSSPSATHSSFRRSRDSSGRISVSVARFDDATASISPSRTRRSGTVSS